MKILKNSLKTELNIRTEKDYPVKGVEFIDITPLIIQKETLQEIIDQLVEELKNQEIDYIVAPEARGFLLGTTVANRLEIGCIPIRKKGKLPPTTVESTFDYEKEYGKDQLELPKLVKETYKNKKIYILDDIYATGNTMKAIQKAIEELGGTVIGKGVIMNIVALNDDEEVFSLLEVEEE
ncbi:MAG: adenine phosphoribosyltransferase [Clostridia bacterium]|nr:adenine phosphoribosyltransferase [Clostridia bacterium]